MNKKVLVTTIMALVIILSCSIIFAQGPKPVLQQLFDVDGTSHPDPTADGAITFQIWITERPEYVLDETALGSRVGMDASNTRFLLQFNLGNFPGSAGAPADWTAGETVRLEVQQEARGLIAWAEFAIAAGGSPIVRYRVPEGDLSITLREPPIVLFDSNEDDLVTTTASLMAGFDPDPNGVYRANDWEEDDYWMISFSTVGYDQVYVFSQIRRQYAGGTPAQARGPKYFVTYFSIDDGDNWVAHGNPVHDELLYHELPDDDSWHTIRFSLPQSCAWKENVMVKWNHIWEDDVNQNGWGEIKNVTVTADESENPPYVLYPPNNLLYELDGYDIELTWRDPAPMETLKYDNDTATGAYSWDGYTMATRMTPRERAQILSIMYYTTTQPGDNRFNAEIYGWAGTRPSTQIIHSETVTAVDDDWVVVDLTAEQIFVTGNFVVGFGSINETTFIAYDGNLNNNRSWDYDPDDNDWYSHNEAYIMRALVLYPDGQPGLLAPSNEGRVMHTRSAGNSSMNVARNDNRRSAAIDAGRIGMPEFLNTFRYPEVIGYNIYRDEVRLNAEMLTEMFFAENIVPDFVYEYYVTAVYTDYEESGPSNIAIVDVVKAGETDLPVLVTQLDRNYPNPFNPTTTISFSIADSDRVKLEVFNSRGQKVTTLIDDYLQAGNHNILWNGRDQYQREVSSGIYFYRMQKGSWTSTNKMILIK